MQPSPWFYRMLELHRQEYLAFLSRHRRWVAARFDERFPDHSTVGAPFKSGRLVLMRVFSRKIVRFRLKRSGTLVR